MRFFSCCSSKAKNPEIGQTQKTEAVLMKQLKKDREAIISSIKHQNLSETDLNRPPKVGILNLGNSCYISSVIQSMSQVTELTEYLMTGKWEADINPISTFGTKGKLLLSYIKLLHQMFECKKSAMSIPDFFLQLGKSNETVASCNG